MHKYRIVRLRHLFIVNDPVFTVPRSFCHFGIGIAIIIFASPTFCINHFHTSKCVCVIVRKLDAVAMKRAFRCSFFSNGLKSPVEFIIRNPSTPKPNRTKIPTRTWLNLKALRVSTISLSLALYESLYVLIVARLKLFIRSVENYLAVSHHQNLGIDEAQFVAFFFEMNFAFFAYGSIFGT